MARTTKLNYISFDGDNVTFLSEVFHYTWNIINIDYPRNLKVIPNNFFANSDQKHVNLPEGITTIKQDAYALCYRLVDADLPSTLVSLCRGVFYGCRNLVEVRIPAATKDIGMFCFMECPKLKRIYNYATTPQQVSEIFDDDAHITIFVPRQSVSLYRKAHGWNTQDIQPMPEE